MEICVFYSWQSKYRDNCDKIIRKALVKALREMNREQGTFHYYLKRGGGDVLGSEHIDNNIDKIINNVADIAIVDFTQDAKAYSPLRSRSAVLPPGPVAVFTDSETNSFHLYAPQLSRI